MFLSSMVQPSIKSEPSLTCRETLKSSQIKIFIFCFLMHNNSRFDVVLHNYSHITYDIVYLCSYYSNCSTFLAFFIFVFITFLRSHRLLIHTSWKWRISRRLCVRLYDQIENWTQISSSVVFKNVWVFGLRISSLQNWELPIGTLGLIEKFRP